ncbi:hypothetical protein J2W91_004636 [Paenibacillus amylolyticus]|uniref:Uncharacterized protein n=1 Tax=Paenibacillus amylolyticus TaxID=1451 RepID=A0AAP5H6J9_PAEAM|nr:hypothetical protein [Paenibacillus amylolyticus]MDR6726130.1 hypothetical protein [Paenibacillus amylolyticus]
MKKGWIMLLLGVGLALSLGWGFNQYTALHKARQTIAEYQDVDTLNQRSEDFIRAYAQGKHQAYLTKAAANRFAREDNREKDHEDVHMSEESGLKNVEIKQLYTKKIKERDDQAESYATVRLQYELGGSNRPTDDYIQTFSLYSAWVKENEEWKVNNVEITLTADSSDDELKRQAKEALENATKARDGE